MSPGLQVRIKERRERHDFQILELTHFFQITQLKENTNKTKVLVVVVVSTFPDHTSMCFR